MGAWSLKSAGGGGGSNAEWFLNQLAIARATLTAANFDTIIGDEFGGTITTELVDAVGAADASANEAGTGGQVLLAVGDSIETLSRGRLQLTGSGAHVDTIDQTPWFMSALVKITSPLDETQLQDTRADAVAVWGDDDNFVALGIGGGGVIGSGGSVTNWLGIASRDASVTTVQGPLLDSDESPLWHLFQAWRAPDGVHFAIDSQEFDNVIDLDDVPTLAGKLSPTAIRAAIGESALVNFDKLAIFVASPTPGEP